MKIGLKQIALTSAAANAFLVVSMDPYLRARFGEPTTDSGYIKSLTGGGWVVV